MQQTKFEMTELSEGTGTVYTDQEKVMVRVKSDDTLDKGPEIGIDLTAFKNITNKRELDRSPSNSANTINRIAKRYD